MSQPKTLDGFLDLAMNEAYSRIQTRPAEIPDHVLFKLLGEINKAIERRDKEIEDETPPYSLLDQLHSLPRVRAKELLREELGRIRAALTLHEEAYQRLCTSEPEPAATPKG